MFATNAILAMIAAASVLWAPVCRAQTDAGKTAVPGAGFPDLDPIMDAVARLRGLAFKRDVPAGVQDVDGWSALLTVEIDKAYPPATRGGTVKGLVKLGMLTESIDFGERLHTAMLTQAGAYYDPETGHFYYLMTEMPESELAVLASHELVHALQDQHFDLDAMMAGVMPQPGAVRNDDAGIALMSLIEGEATYLMFLWQSDRIGRDLTASPRIESATFSMLSEMSMEMMVQMAQAAGVVYGEESEMGRAMASMDDLPLYILEPLYAAYMKGAFFTMSVRQAGGWEAMTDAYASPPRSTEQILHPEKYIGGGEGGDGSLRDDPTAIHMPVFASLMAEGYTVIDEAVHGELYLGMLLRNFGLNVWDVESAVEGWDGDVYRALELPGGAAGAAGAGNGAGENGVSIVLATTWDTEADATEFADMYLQVLAAKYPASSARAWQGDEGTYAGTLTEEIVRGRRIEGTLTTRGLEVFIVEGLTRKRTAGVMRRLLAMPIERVR